MKDVLVDMQLAENIIAENVKSYTDSAHKAAIFESVFRKHRITQAIYDSSLVWYGRNLDVYMQVYDLALAEINTRINDLGDVQAAPSSVTNQDSVNIWPRRNRLELYPQAVFNGVVFDVTPNQPYEAGSTFELQLRVWGLNNKMRNYPEIRMTVDMSDTSSIADNVLRTDGFSKIKIGTPKDKSAHRIYGYIRMDEAETDYARIYIDSISLIKIKPLE
jgi:hypothetical protein